MSVITSILGFTKDVLGEKSREEQRARQRAADELKNPIPPPFFYKTIKAREKAESGEVCSTEEMLRRIGKSMFDPNVVLCYDEKLPDSYTVKGIRDELSGGILPVGYSEEQLTTVGFGPEVKKYQAALLAADVQLRHDVGKLLKALLAIVDDKLKSEERRAYISAGATRERVDRIREVSEKAINATDPEQLDIGAIISVFKELETLQGAGADEVKAGEDLRQLNIDEVAAQDDRTEQVLLLAQRAYLNKRPSVAPTVIEV